MSDSRDSAPTHKGSSRRTPTEKQYRSLLILGGGSMLISGIIGEKRHWNALLRHGWVAPEKPDDDNGIRITPEGLRALALGVETYGLPDLFRKREPKPEPPLAQQLREARDEAREEAQEVRRELRTAQTAIRRAGAALNGDYTF